jgi:quercetin dioxygenase-like cupin family protein
MRVVRIQDAAGYDRARFVARPLLEGDQSNVRIIRLSPGQALPPHRHGQSDLMLFVVEGQGELETPDGVQPFAAGSLAFYRGDEELRVRNAGVDGVTLLAFLSPKFATA